MTFTQRRRFYLHLALTLPGLLTGIAVAGIFPPLFFGFAVSATLCAIGLIISFAAAEIQASLEKIATRP